MLCCALYLAHSRACEKPPYRIDLEMLYRHANQRGEETMLTAAIVVAAGRGTRFGGDLPKQYQTLGSEPILTVTLRALLGHPGIGAIVTAIAPDADEMYRGATADGICGPWSAASMPIFVGDPSRLFEVMMR